MAKSAAEFFSMTQTADLIERLKAAGVNMKSLKEKSDDQRFAGLTFVLTGTLPTLSRKEATEIIENLGGKASASVSKKDFVCRRRRGSRKQTAKSDRPRHPGHNSGRSAENGRSGINLSIRTFRADALFLIFAPVCGGGEAGVALENTIEVAQAVVAELHGYFKRCHLGSA